MSFISLDTFSQTLPLKISVETADDTSLSIHWNLNRNTTCFNQSLLTISLTKLMSCQDLNQSHIDSPQKGILRVGETYNMSRVVDAHITFLTMSFLLPNCTYNIEIELAPFMCKELVARGFNVFDTIIFG